jgi:hypothetical protein
MKNVSKKLVELYVQELKPYKIERVEQPEKVNKSGELRIRMYKTLPNLRVGESFLVPFNDFHGEFKEFQKTVSAMLCIFERDKTKRTKKFKTCLNKESKEIKISRTL